MIGLRAMQPLRATVKNGRITLDEPTDLPEGTVLELEAVDTLDDMDPEDREALMQCLERSIQEAEQGLVVPAEEVLAKLRRKRE
jgi:hypothetical protein